MSIFQWDSHYSYHTYASSKTGYWFLSWKKWPPNWGPRSAAPIYRVSPCKQVWSPHRGTPPTHELWRDENYKHYRTKVCMFVDAHWVTYGPLGTGKQHCKYQAPGLVGKPKMRNFHQGDSQHLSSPIVLCYLLMGNPPPEYSSQALDWQ